MCGRLRDLGATWVLRAGRIVVDAAAFLVRSDLLLVQLAGWYGLRGKTRAARHLDHYLQGRGTPLFVDTSLLLAQDTGVCALFCESVRASLAGGASSGLVRVPQWAFANRAWRYALGSISLVWRRHRGGVEARVEARYAWSPGEPRATRRVHQAAARLQRAGAAEYALQGTPAAFSVAAIQTTVSTKSVPLRDRVYM